MQAARWRQVLEQAQWQKLGEQPSHGKAHNSGDSLQAAARDLARIPAGLAAAAPDPSVGGSGAQFVADRVPGCGASPSADASRVAVAPIEPGPGETTAVAAAAAATTIPAAATSTPLASGPPEAAPAEPALPHLPDVVVATPWPPFNAQAHVDGRAVSAAVRDPRLASDDADELGRRLATQLAADGLELVELRVNGRVAGPPPREPR
ncbi:MAG: hypothetical protein ACJ8G7_25020 [Rhizobacter sp.]